MAGIQWLISYPKSGNTWLRVLLANYLGADAAPADINQLARSGMTAIYLRAVIDQLLGFKSACLPPHLLERLRPDVARALAAHAPSTLILKAHDCWGRTDRGEPLFPADVTAGVLYVARNPLDIAASAADHWGVGLAEAVERMCEPEDWLSGDPDNIDAQVPQWIGSWSEHVTSWLDESGLPVHLVRYEDLTADPEATLAAALAFMGLPADPARVAHAVEHSRFDRLQVAERETGFVERSPAAQHLFFRRGKAGSWRDELQPALVDRLIEAHGDTMLRLGYLDERGEPLIA